MHHVDGKEVTLKLHRMLHVPEMSVNLLSVKDVTDRGFRFYVYRELLPDPN